MRKLETSSKEQSTAPHNEWRECAVCLPPALGIVPEYGQALQIPSAESDGVLVAYYPHPDEHLYITIACYDHADGQWYERDRYNELPYPPRYWMPLPGLPQ